MEFEYILAKKSRTPKSPHPDETLVGHTSKVIESFRTMFGSEELPTRLAHQWLHFFKVEESFFKSFFVNGLVACGLHDIGKANDGFQSIVRGFKTPQTIWHEHLSGVLLLLPGMQSWIGKISSVDKRIVLSTVIGHHLRSASPDFAMPLNPDILRFRVFPEGISPVLNLLFTEVGCPQSDSPNIPYLWSFEGDQNANPGVFREIIRKTFYKFTHELNENPVTNRLLTAVRAALILADSAGSAMVRENKNIQSWIETAFGEILNGQFIQEHILAQRVRQIEAKKGNFRWNDFQIAAEGLPNRSLLISPCGSGKTLAAWRWIKARLAEKPAARVIFLYPTRATATEGFRDYVSWAPEADATLISGTAAYELQGMFENPDDERYGKVFFTEDKLFSLGFWHRRVFSATVDQFLGFMQHVYRSICLLPLLADSVVVIDEVHSFDRSLFSTLKLFLKAFEVPVLCMTASLPLVRRKDLTEEGGLKLFPSDVAVFSDLEAIASMPRYNVQIVDGPDDAQLIADRAIKEGKRVLWVVNTVSRCQQIARRNKALCYHSRFRLSDRKDRHLTVVSAFTNENNPVLAITTQVCEMSLDLDADVLISEVAPVTSMIQRMGRCNRHATPGSNKMGTVYFYSLEDEKPYGPADLFGAEKFLHEIGGRMVSQVALEDLLEQYGPNEQEIEKYSAFLESGPWARSREESLRDENEFTVNAILSDDIPLFFEMRNKKKLLDGLFISVPRRFAREHPRMGRFPLVAESSHYNPQFGFFDTPLEEII